MSFFSWLFRRKPAGPASKSRKQIDLELIQDSLPIGSRFRYLGRECVVTGHTEHRFHELGMHWWPELKAEYADDLGVIRYVRFSMAETRALIAMQPGESDGS